jgi:hypothetical protein
MSESITDTEIKAIRWVEHILAPLLVTAIAGLVVFAVNTSESMAEIQANQEKYDLTNGDIKRSIKESQHEQKQMIMSQHQIEITVERMETHQEHFREEIEGLNNKTDQIIELLREPR